VLLPLLHPLREAKKIKRPKKEKKRVREVTYYSRLHQKKKEEGGEESGIHI